MAQIFLCHASDDKAQVREVYYRLAAIEGFEPWLDEENLLPGQIWADEIPRALKASEFILVFFSRNSVAKRGYVQREMKMALNAWEEIPGNMIHTIPVRLDECELPEPFGRYHRADLFNPRGFDRLVQGLHLGLEQRGISMLTPLESPINESEPPSDNPPPPAAQSKPDTAVILPDETAAIIEAGTLPQTFTNSIGIEFIQIPTGTFLMGTADGGEWERPEHLVRISHPFYLGKYPVTQAQWATVMGNNPSVFKGHPDWPVENVSWEEVHVFIQTLKAREAGEDYRLPTEAEWEYACRAGSTTSYCFGDDPNQLGEYAWYRENSGGQPHPVGLLKPNAWGLYDMHGNVWEWVQDWYRPYATDPLSASPDLERVNRGGSWVWDARFCRSATRGHLTPGHRAYDTGFRCAMSVPSK